MRPEMERGLQSLNRTNVLLEAGKPYIHIAIPDPQAPNGINLITHPAQDLVRVPPFGSLSPEEYGFALLPAGGTVTLGINKHTQILLEESSGTANLLLYRVVVDGVVGHPRILNRPVVLGSNPHFQPGDGRSDNIALVGVPDDASLYLCPGLDPNNHSGFVVVNTSETQPVTVLSTSTKDQRVSIPFEDMPTVRWPDDQSPPARRPEAVNPYPPVISGAAVEAKSPQEPTEDRMHIKRKPTSTLLLADGMGGYGHGEWAANEAIRIVSGYENDERNIPLNATSTQVKDGLYQALKLANNVVSQPPLDVFDPEQDEDKPGTTMIAGRIVYGEGPTGIKAVIAWAGDSRAYLQHPDGRIEHITVDDNIQQAYARAKAEFAVVPTEKGPIIEPYNKRKHKGLTPQRIDEAQAKEIDWILDHVSDPAQLQNWYGPKDARNERLQAFYRMRNIVSGGLGGNNNPELFEPHVIIKDIEPGSTIWYTSDGTHDVLPEEILPPGTPHQELYLFDAFRAASNLPQNTHPDARAQFVLQAVNAWNQAHPTGRRKIDDKAVGYQHIPLAA